MITILGAGGHAKVCYSALKAIHGELTQCKMQNFDVFALPHSDTGIVIGVGDIQLRKTIFLHYEKEEVIGFLHPSAIVEYSAVGKTAQVMAGVIVQPGSRIGENVILNTRCVVDHDCVVGSHSHVAPGAVLCGGAHVGADCFIGAGAVIANGAYVEDGTFVKAGSVIK